jgi:multimeric flavodoxin WrbA
MYIVGINGSPNKEGNTAYLLNKGLVIARELGAKTEIIHAAEVLKEVKVPFCTVCSNPCRGICALNTSLAEAHNVLREADGILVGSPVYFGSVTGQLKAFWDKTRCLRGEKKLLNTVGGAIAVGATRFGGQEGTIRSIQEMMLVQGITLVGAGQAEHDCGHFGVAAQKPAEEDQQAQERVTIMAKRIYEVATATNNLRL